MSAVEAIALAWLWIVTVIATVLWFSYRYYRKACHQADAALQAHRIAAAKDRAALMDEHWRVQTAQMDHFTERLRQIVDDLRRRNDKEDTTERKTTA